MSYKPELLAPAGSLKVLKAAVNTGADAVYFGLRDDFNARGGAENFSKEDCYTAMDYLKARGKKAYITLNTLIKNTEIKKFLSTLEFLSDLQPDAVIVQDLGAAELIKESTDLEIHASTQMTVHNSDGVNNLYKKGIKRIVLARELSLNDIKSIRESTEAELEVFIHGALCVCYSGQCLMSSFIGERSGNRGKCAQPCRLKYSFNDNKEKKYYLSLSDLTTVNQIKKLCDLKIESFKIEGRLKSEYYVAAAVDVYRKILDGEKLLKQDINLLYTVFDRGGYTDGYLTGKKGGTMFCIDKNENPFTDGEGAAIKRYKGIINSEDKKQLVRRPVDFDVKVTLNEKIKLSARLGGKKVTAVSDYTVAPSDSLPLTEEKLKASLAKLGDTSYYLNSLTAVIDDGCYVPLSEINKLRREAVLLLNDISCEDKEHKFTPPKLDFNPRSRCEIKLISGIKYAKQYEYTVQDSEFVFVPFNQIEKIKKPDFEKIAAKLPRIISNREKEYVSKTLAKLKELGCKYAVCSNISHTELCEGFGVFISPYMNITNDPAIKYLQPLNLVAAGVSHEMNLKDIRFFSPGTKIFAQAYGNTELMITENCIKKSIASECDKSDCYLTDRKGEKFRLSCAFGCRNVILNPFPTAMPDKLDDMERCGIDYALLSFTNETEQEIYNIFNMFKSRQNLLKKFTRGHFYRGAK